MANFNKVLLMGNLTRDPELRHSTGGSGTAICKFGLAVNRQWRSASGESQEETCFCDIVVFGRQAETCNEYLSKGRPVFVEGRLSFSSWEDRESGQRRSKLEIVAERVQFLGGRSEGGGGGGGGGFERRQQGGFDRGAQQQPQQPQEQQQQRAPAAAPRGTAAPAASGGGGGIDFDDIPF